MEEKLSAKDRVEIVIESGLQLIPWVGGPLATLYFSTKQEKRFKRLETFYRELADEIEALKVQLASVEEHDPEKLASLIEDLNEKVEKEHLEEKRRYFKNFMRNTLQTPTQHNYDERKFFLDVLGGMSLLECELLPFVASQGRIQVKQISKPGTSQYAIVGAVGRLLNHGFLRSSQNQMVIGGGDNALLQIVSVTDYGTRFIQFCLE